MRLVVSFSLLCTLMFSPAQPLHAQVYRWVDEQGQVHYTQTPPPQQDSEAVTIHGHREVDQTRGRYCAAVAQAAAAAASAMRRGLRLEAALAAARNAEAEASKDLDDATYQKLIYQVWSYRSSRMGNAEIADLIRGECMNGAYGRKANTQTSNDTGSGPATRGGSGFMVGGLIATNHHVVKNARRIQAIFADGRSADAILESSNTAADIALLRVTGLDGLPPSLPVAEDEAAMGAEVFTLGFPHTGIMGANAKLSTGIISSRTGIRDDPDAYQISVPVQAGNSGGPLVNRQGEVVGIVTAKLSAQRMLDSTGDLTENVNYAVKIRLIEPLMTGPSSGWGTSETASLEDTVARVQPSVVRLVVD